MANTEEHMMDYDEDGQRLEEARNKALTNIVVLESIIGFLPVTDMRSCRLVNSIWLDAASAQLRKKDRPEISDVETVQSFLELWGSQDELMESEDKITRPRPPFSEIALSLDKMECDESLLDSLFITMAPFITRLNLILSVNNRYYQFSNDDVYKQLSYPNLSEYFIHLDGSIENSEDVTEDGDDGGRYRGLICGILKNTPNLRELRCYGSSATRKYLHFLIDTLKERKCGNKKLKMFGTYSGGIMDLHFARMADELALNLETLHISTVMNEFSLGPDESGLFRFLQGQGESLKLLYLRGLRGLFEYFGVPKMKKLETLMVEDWKPVRHALAPTLAPSVNYQGNLPVIKKIKFSDYDHDEWIQLLPHLGSPPIASLLELKLPTKVINVAHIEHCVRSFPNLKILRIPATVPYLNLVYKYLPEVEELILDTSNITNIDDAITGFSSEECEMIGRFTDKMLRRMPIQFNEDHPEEDDLARRPMSVLKHLKVLRLRPRLQQNKVELTKVSSRLVLSKMESLEILDLSHRSPIALTGFEDVMNDMDEAGKDTEYRGFGDNDDDDDDADVDVVNHIDVDVFDWTNRVEDPPMLNRYDFPPPAHY